MKYLRKFWHSDTVFILRTFCLELGLLFKELGVELREIWRS